MIETYTNRDKFQPNDRLYWNKPRRPSGKGRAPEKDRERSRTGHTRREPAQGERQGPYIIEIGGEIVSNAVFIRAEELAQELEISKAKAYKMIRQWNEELRVKGYATVNGRVSRQYYLEHMYGMTENKKED